MCGRYAGFQSMAELRRRFGAGNSKLDFKPNYNIAPSHIAPIIIKEDHKIVTLGRFGMIPHWAKDTRFAPINAKSETILEKKMFAESFKHKRCLIPASGFFEWAKIKGGGKQPYYFKVKNSDLFGFAAIYDEWKSEDGTEVKGFAILTTEPNGLVKKVHDRMPVILHQETEDLWVNQSTSTSKLLSLLKPYEEENMISYPVPTFVNDPSYNNKNAITPVDEYRPEDKPLFS